MIKNSVKGDAMSTSFEMKGADVFCGLIPGIDLTLFDAFYKIIQYYDSSIS